LVEGDIQSKTVLVERKTIPDLWASLNDGRFKSQVSRITTHQCDKVVIFLITGSIDEWVFKMRKLKINVNENMIDGAIASLLVRDNIRLLIDSNEKRALKRLVRMITKIEEEDVLNIPSARNTDMLMARYLNIPKDTWFDIKDMYGGSIRHLCSLTEKDLLKVRRIGKIRAKKIISILKNGE